MERNANYTLVGFSALFLMLGAAVFAIWLGQWQFNRDYDEYDILFKGPVTGLVEGGEVRFNGIKVGEVSEIGLDRTDPSYVVARARVTSDVPIRIDSYATLEPQGITGVNYVQISAGAASLPLLKDATPDGRVPVIQTKTSALSGLLEGGGTVLARAVEALDRVNKVLSDENIAGFSATLSDVGVVTASLKERKEMFADAQSALQSIDRAAKDISTTAASAQGLVDKDGKKALADIGAAADEIRVAATEARSAINEAKDTVSALRGPAVDFTTNTLPQVQGAVIGLQSAAESLERLANEIEQNPRQLLSKEPAKEIEVAP